MLNIKEQQFLWEIHLHHLCPSEGSFQNATDRSEATSSSPVKEGVQIQYSEPDRPSAKKVQTPLIRDYISVKPVNEQDAQSMFKMDVAAKKEYVSQKTIADPYNKPEDQSAKSMLKMVVAVKEETVSQMKIIDPSNKSQDQSGQSMLKMDVAAKKESVPQKKIVDPSNKPENQSGRSMFKMDVAAKKESVSNKKIVDPSSKPEDQGAQYVLRVNVAAKKESVSETKIVDPPNKPEDQRVLEKTPSSVRNMISAFETGLAQKGRRSLTRNRASKSQPNLVGIGGSLKDLDPEDTAMPNKMSALRVERPLNNANLPEPQRNIDKRGESSPPEHKIDGPGQPVFYEKLKQSSVHIVPFNEAGSGQQDTLRSTKKESNTVATSPVDLMRLSNLETATSSQRINVAHSDMLNANNLAADQDRSSDPSVAEQRNREIRSEALLEVHIERVPNEKPKLIAYCENEHYDSENSGVWIFPDNKNRVCITTAGESAVHLLEDCHIGVDDHQRNKKPPKQEITRKRGFFHKSDSTIKKGEEKPQKPRKSQSESSGQNGPSGPIRQVIKIAVIVGFGILVLLTRQKETRRNDRKSKEFYFASPDFIDQLASSEEKWSLLTAEGN